MDGADRTARRRRVRGTGIESASPRPVPTTLPVGTLVEMLRARPLAVGGLLRLQAGDVVKVVRVHRRAYAVELLGVVATVLHDDVVPAGAAQ